MTERTSLPAPLMKLLAIRPSEHTTLAKYTRKGYAVVVRG
jgi:hypothetical protein